MDKPVFATVIDLEKNGGRADALRLALSMYLGERCRFCDRTYETMEDLRDTVFAGYHEHGRLACKACWDALSSEEIAALKAESNEGMMS